MGGHPGLARCGWPAAARSGAQTVEETAATLAAAIGQDRFALQPGNSAAVSRPG